MGVVTAVDDDAKVRGSDDVVRQTLYDARREA
jgi:hypothetical protein